MQYHTVKELMVPLAEYATVPEEATLYEIVLALENAQREFDQTRYRHRAMLVFDHNRHVVGKISQLDILKALEPKYEQVKDSHPISHFGYSPQFLKKMLKQFSLLDKPLRAICKKAHQMKARDFMYTPTEGEYIREDATLDEAIHQLVMGHHQSLLVTRENEIVGVLRVTDVFREICDTIKACEVDPSS